MTDGNASPYLLALIQQQEFIGLLGLGKLADPSTGEAKVDLDKTRYAIGMLEMLEQKTAGNLEDAERRQLRQVLTTMRLNFVEEARRGPAAGAAGGGAPGGKGAEAPGAPAGEGATASGAPDGAPEAPGSTGAEE
jgi:hypothetical protein